MNLIPMLGKPSGATRTVAKTPMCWRLLCKDIKQVEEWESDSTEGGIRQVKGKVH